jgi:sterol desaturase/sphingolipid hydroxylase (fatty acid hydroxylase superfamily)
MSLIYFIAWTFLLYWLHRIIHATPVLQRIHAQHHGYINTHSTAWSWNNLVLFNDNWICTLDLWITDVIPTVAFAWLTGQWWLVAFYYIWAAFIQEQVEHNPKFSLYPYLHSGKWHLVHHKNSNKNFGMFIIIWDILFSTHADYD